MYNSLIRNKLFLTLILISFLILSCNKKTQTDFRLERYNYEPGETLDLINLSPNKRNQIWEIINPDGGSDLILEGQAPQLKLNVIGKDGIYILRVFDNKFEQRKNISSDKTFMVSAERGKVVINSNSLSSVTFPIYIDNQKVPGKHGASFKLPVGFHSIKASCVYYSGGPTHKLDTVVKINSQPTTYLYLD